MSTMTGFNHKCMPSLHQQEPLVSLSLSLLLTLQAILQYISAQVSAHAQQVLICECSNLQEAQFHLL